MNETLSNILGIFVIFTISVSFILTAMGVSGKFDTWGQERYIE